MGVVTRDVLAEQLAERAEITMAAARDEVKWFFDTISGSLTGGDEVRIHGFGTFKTAQRAARTGRNPRTGESVQVPARRGAFLAEHDAERHVEVRQERRAQEDDQEVSGDLSVR